MAQGPSDTILVAIRITLRIRESKVRNPDPPDRRRFVLCECILVISVLLFNQLFLKFLNIGSHSRKDNLWITAGVFLQAECPCCHPTSSIKALKADCLKHGLNHGLANQRLTNSWVNLARIVQHCLSFQQMHMFVAA